MASAAALAGIDLASVDPKAILQAIAADTSAPISGRVMACKALMASQGAKPASGGAGSDPVTDLALKLLRGKK